MKFVFESLSPEAREQFGKGEYGGDHVLIGKTLAAEAGLREGDPISLYSPTGADSAFGNLGGLEKTYIVGGVYTSGAADYDRAFIFMPLEQTQLFFGKDGVWDIIEMKVAEPDKVENLLAPVQRAAGAGNVVTDWRNRQAAIWGALQVERTAMSIILGMVVAIAAMNIISGIVMLVKNKTRDIAILRTVGASQSSILRIFFVSGAAIGIGGTIAGLVLGLLFCWNIGAIQHFLEGLLGVQLFNAEVYMLDPVPAKVDLWDVVGVTVFSFLMSCLASLPRRGMRRASIRWRLCALNRLLKKKPVVAPETNGAILSLRGVTRTYPTAQGGLTVLKGVDLEVMPGEVVGLIGPSGSGKSSLLHAAGLLERPTSGQVLIDGEDVGGLDERARTRLRLHRIGFVYQFHHLLPEFDALDNVALPMRIAGVREGRRVAARPSS